MNPEKVAGEVSLTWCDRKVPRYESYFTDKIAGCMDAVQVMFPIDWA